MIKGSPLRADDQCSVFSEQVKMIATQPPLPLPSPVPFPVLSEILPTTVPENAPEHCPVRSVVVGWVGFRLTLCVGHGIYPRGEDGCL